MTETETETNEETESKPEWIAKTAGYVALAVFATVVLANAFQSFFFEQINGTVTLLAAAAVTGAIGRSRRHRWPKPESRTLS